MMEVRMAKRVMAILLLAMALQIAVPIASGTGPAWAIPAGLVDKKLN